MVCELYLVKALNIQFDNFQPDKYTHYITKKLNLYDPAFPNEVYVLKKYKIMSIKWTCTEMFRASEIAQYVKVPAANPDNLSFIS